MEKGKKRKSFAFLPFSVEKCFIFAADMKKNMNILGTGSIYGLFPRTLYP